MGTTKKIKKEIKAKSIGRNVILIIDDIKYSRSFTDKEERLNILKEVETYNKRNSIKRAKDIIKIMEEPKRLKEEAKQQKKKELESKKKNIQKGNKKSGTKKINKSTKSKKEEVKKKTKLIKPTLPNESRYRRRGEY